MATHELKRLTNKQIRDLKGAFDLFDQDESGVISLDEYIRVMEGLNQDVDRQEIEDLFRGSDPDGDPNINFSEFLMYYAKRNKGDTPGEVELTFDMFDIQKNNGKIYEDEFFALNELTGIGFTDQEIKALYTEFDQDHDTAFDIGEFSEIMRRATELVKKEGI